MSQCRWDLEDYDGSLASFSFLFGSEDLVDGAADLFWPLKVESLCMCAQGLMLAGGLV